VTDWTVVVSADRGYYDLVRSEGEPDGGGIPFPADHQDRSIPLSGGRIRIGRRSRSDRERPEIDLAGPPEDPGVSHRHAVLLAGQDGWAVQDLGSTNGTTINDGTEPIPPEASVPLADGDRIHLGAWTTLTLRATPGRKA
jgi:pSer/pThr/pTyr-binding forkhead associated (FHA) protein